MGTDNLKESDQGQRRSDNTRRQESSSEPSGFTQPERRETVNTPKKITPKDVQANSKHLHQDFQVHKSKRFSKGSVFKVMWSEPFGDSNPESTTDVTQDEMSCVEHAKYGERAYHCTRRFVVVKAREGHCVCVPILTYSRQGTNKPGVKAANHAIIHTTETAPGLLPGEKDTHKRPVRVDMANPREHLAPESRVNYSKVYTVEHNIKVCFIGKIHRDSEATFFEDFKYVDSKD